MLKKILRNFIAKHLFKMITERDFLRLDPKTGLMWIGNHQVNKSEMEAFAKSAKDLKQNDAYILIMREMWSTGEKKVFFEGHDEKVRQHGMDTLWVLDLINKKVENMARLSK